MIDWSRTPIVSKSPRACGVTHLRAGAIISVGLDPSRIWTEYASWTRRVDGPQVLEPTSTRYISWGMGCPKGMVRHFHVLETLAPLSPAVAPDLAVHRRSSSSHVWIPAEVLYVSMIAGVDRLDRIGDFTASRRYIDNPQLRV